MMRFLHSRGLNTPAVSDLPPDKRRMFWLFLAAAVIITAVCAWAFASGHAAIGIAVLVAFYVLPEFVLLPLRNRCSRRAAEAATARRKATTAP
jgi:Flp pilus assembly protein TadB